MPFYIQYDSQGYISTVIADTAPACENQIAFAEPFDTSGKMLDLNTMQLVDLPPPEE